MLVQKMIFQRKNYNSNVNHVYFYLFIEDIREDDFVQFYFVAKAMLIDPVGAKKAEKKMFYQE